MQIKNLYKLIKFSLCIFITVASLQSCITARKTNYLQSSSSFIPSYNDSIGYEEYILNPTDKLFIYIYSPDQKTNTLFNGSSQGMSTMLMNSDYSDLFIYTVSDAGTIKLPIIGDLDINGLTIRDTKQKIQSAIQSIIKDECSVDLRMVSRYFSVIGSTTNGRYPILREKMNIFQALALAGDINTFGDRGAIKLLRETSHGVKVSTFDIRSKDIINSEYYYIQPNDVIYIQDVKSQFFSVTSFGAALSTTFSSISFAVLIYNLLKPVKDTTKTTTP